MTITICSSATFYRQVMEIADQLRGMGFSVLVPTTAERMRKNNDWCVEHYKTWFENPTDYTKKQELMRGHFDKVIAGDVCFVVNFEKRGIPGYVGGNVLMEMGIAFHFFKPIYLLHRPAEDSPIKEEIFGLATDFLDGDIKRLLYFLSHRH